MAHAFRSAAHIEAENAQRKIERLRDRWTSTRDTWFDGTVRSVDRRIGHADEVISFARSIGSRLHQSKVGGMCLAMLPQLRADRAALEGLRERLLTAGDSGLITGPEETGVQPLSPDTLGDMRGNIADWNSSAITAAGCPGPECTGVQPLSRDRVHQMRDERNQWREDEEPTHRSRAEDMGFTRDDINRLKSHQAAREFIEDQNTTDRTELLFRAQRLVEERTWDWTPQSARQAVRDFVGAVSAQIPRQVRQAARTAETVEDFDDQLLFN